mmetsp:Transcript_37317/g.87283  ORF Transcript_37317/g.87283 Transcript_37317/m.87283 type:complete len:90 (-) Transcript_37317:1094-1363(-)
MDDGSCVTESLDTTRRVATDFTEHARLLPPAEAPAVDAFVGLWTRRVEPAYYAVLSAPSESVAKRRLVGFVEALAAVEQQLWQRAMEAS